MSDWIEDAESWIEDVLAWIEMAGAEAAPTFGPGMIWMGRPARRGQREEEEWLVLS
jgi:hypothetical protein